MLNKLKYFIVASMLLCVSAYAAKAEGMTCRDYADSRKAFEWCRTGDDKASRMNCCAGAAAWKTACNVFHVLAEDHAAASALAYSTPKARRITEANIRECAR